MFGVHFGVRQGSSLSPYLFAVYVDDLAKLCLYNRDVYIVLYADDILLLAPSVSSCPLFPLWRRPWFEVAEPIYCCIIAFLLLIHYFTL